MRPYIRKKLVLGTIAGAFLFSGTLKAQYQENALRFSEINVNGTARFQGLGGGHAALGGDASSITANPAGLAFYSRSEVSITPGFESSKSDSRFLNTATRESKNGAFLGNVSLVIANRNRGFSQSKWKGTAMGVSFNRQQSFRRSYGYAGNSTGRRFIDHIASSANSFSDNELKAGYREDSQTGEIYLDYLEGVYYNLYAFDPESDQANAPFVPTERTSPVAPSGYVDNKGSHSQWTFSYAGNYDDKLYIGGSIGFSRISNSQNQMLDERYLSGEVFKSTRYEQWADMSGNGFNFTLGAIYKLNPDFQFGLNLSTPTFMRLRRSLYERASVELIKADDLPTVGRTNPWDFDYSQTGPFRASLGGTWFLPGQLGFVTASADYVGYKGMKISHDREADGSWNNLDGWYKNVVNPRLGVEIRHQTFRVRAGAAYFADPFAGKIVDMKEDRISFSGGIGYRGNKFFADAAVVTGNQKLGFQTFAGSDAGRTTYRDVSGLLTLGFNF
ncbi:outer membrane protein transport protein [Ravibacter arvi]|uniref:Outer membrane protein transport protein n=1 Tax=Ravibacter arvi TaxID=2051041 RepID=A0ABP8M2E4_9BACT